MHSCPRRASPAHRALRPPRGPGRGRLRLAPWLPSRHVATRLHLTSKEREQSYNDRPWGREEVALGPCGRPSRGSPDAQSTPPFTMPIAIGRSTSSLRLEQGADCRSRQLTVTGNSSFSHLSRVYLSQLPMKHYCQSHFRHLGALHRHLTAPSGASSSPSASSLSR